MYLFFDTETTGLPRSWKAPAEDIDNWPRLVQIAWIRCDENGKESEKRSFIVKPEGFSIPLDVADIHGVSNDRALKEGVPVDQALLDFADSLERSTHLIAHNMNFDLKVVTAEFIRAGMDADIFAQTMICTKEEATEYCGIPGPYGNKWPTLAELHDTLFEADFDQTHDALDDVEACARCFFELIKRGVIEEPRADAFLA